MLMLAGGSARTAGRTSLSVLNSRFGRDCKVSWHNHHYRHGSYSMRFMSMSSSVVPAITPYAHPPEPFIKSPIVSAPSPTIQGSIVGPTVLNSRRHRHRLLYGPSISIPCTRFE
ncbi:hypothetical protein L1987_55135 [Smallanthus sonchifolius]|uniref:Uncharacterized protein n=1 Tax=Smallanthus sonchifolius TaxID=185202 RepID=A0ACB9E9R9_9ASTR|nr:hypothetical protein L1987_55135 [Smallanthus sonchifolius]